MVYRGNIVPGRPRSARIARALSLPLLASIWCASLLTSLAADPGASPTPVASPISAPSVPPATSPTPIVSSAKDDPPLPTATPTPAGSPSPVASATPSQNVTINLINRLVQRGVLTKEDADELIKQAEADAERAKEETAKANATPAPGSGMMTPGGLLPSPEFMPPQNPLANAGGNAVPPATTQEPPPALEPGPDDTVRVTYIPEVVKAQLRDEIRQEVMEQARDERWAAPRSVPEWVSRIKLFGDVRFRYEGISFPSGNDNTGAFPNFNAINTGPPFDVSKNNPSFPPELNVDKDRNRFRIRVRVGLSADLGDGFSIGIRGATGENDSPVTENQTVGAANSAQGGNFSKYAIWLDRAFLKYEIGCVAPDRDLSITVGRFDNPFFSTTLIWANDLGFDGVVLQGRYEVFRGVTPFLTLGAFPVFNTDLNFASTNPAKFNSEDKYLFAIQGGTDWALGHDFSGKLGLAYYYFKSIEGRLSSPFTPLTSSDQGNTDDSRPAFAQNGNTYMALRNIVGTAANNFNQINQFQYFGLATPFHELAFTGRLDYNHFEPFQVSLAGEFVTNVAFDRNQIARIAVNNRSTATVPAIGSFAGGNTAWIINLTAGSGTFQKRWDWNVGVGYRYVESDSVVDGFNDSDFGAPLYGTNLKGYTIFGNLALTPNVYVGIRWMSANQIAGPPFKSDVLQIDINGRF